MALISAETRSKIIVILIIFACVATAVLLGVVIFELPWKSSKDKASPAKMKGEEDFQMLPPMTSFEKAIYVLERFPVIDGHNDLPWNLRKLVQNDLRKVNFSQDLTKVEPWASYNESYTDIPRLKKGHVGGLFWVAYTECSSSQGKDAVSQTLEQIDVIHRMIQEYPDDFQFCSRADDILAAVVNKKIASLIGIEGGHSIQYSAAILRQMYALGVRYLTLTHNCNTPWVDSSLVDKKENPIIADNQGLSEFGLELIDEMNRIGMMIDLSHVSEATMKHALARSKAPVLFSHSGAKAICDHPRNVGDEVLQLLKENGGIIMVNFYSAFVQCDSTKNATLYDVIDHIEHIRDLIGSNHIGLGGDYDGVDSVPHGLEDISKYPFLFEALVERGWALSDLRKLSFDNIRRVMTGVETVKYELFKEKPMQSLISNEDLDKKNTPTDCLSSKSFYQLEIHNPFLAPVSNSQEGGQKVA